MLRKCKVGIDKRPAYFHGWFQLGNNPNITGVVEYEDGTTDYFGPRFITFDEPPSCDISDIIKRKHGATKIDPPCECIHEYTACNNEHTINGVRFYCSLPNGHGGDHVSCHGAMHKVASWSQCGCHHDKSPCLNKHGGYCCSLPKGHTGDHVACGVSECRKAIWPNEGKEKSSVTVYDKNWPKICECGDHINLGDEYAYDVSTGKYLCKNCVES